LRCNGGCKTISHVGPRKGRQCRPASGHPTRLSWCLPGPASGRTRRRCGPLRKPAFLLAEGTGWVGPPLREIPTCRTPPQGHPPNSQLVPSGYLLLTIPLERPPYICGPAVTPLTSVVRGLSARQTARVHQDCSSLLSSLTARDTNTHIVALAIARTISAVLSRTGHAAFGLMRLVAEGRDCGARARRCEVEAFSGDGVGVQRAQSVCSDLFAANAGVGAVVVAAVSLVRLET